MSAPNFPQVIGLFGLTETPNSPRVHSDLTKSSITRIYEGTFAQAQSGVPTLGQAFSDLPGTVTVADYDLEKMPGDKGRLTVIMETAAETTFETEWVEVDKALILNPRYWDGSTPDLTPAGAKPLTLLDKAMIEKWEAEENYLLKQIFVFKVVYDPTNNTGLGSAVPIGADPNSPTTTTIAGQSVTSPTLIAGVSYVLYELSANAQDYATKRLKGEESYRLYAPVIRQTSETDTAPTANPCGLIEQPPHAANPPSGYTWQRSAQRITRTGPYGKYRLQLEWQGAERIDADIYGGDPSSVAADPTLFGPIDLSAGSGPL
jgi:hypothetical protein